MRKLSLALLLLATSFGSALAQAPDAKAAEIIKQARAAVGKEDKFKAIQTLSAEGVIRQAAGPNGSQENTLELEMMMPDKLKMTTTMQFGAITRAFDGTGIWTEFVPAVGMGGGGMGRMMGGGGPGGPGGGNPAMATYMQQQQIREFNQIFLAWFLAPPANAKMTYAFVGEAPGPDGAKLNVVEAKTGDGVSTLLYFNQENSRLIGLSYKAKSMRMGRGGPGGGQQRPAGAPAADGGQRQGGAQPQAGGQQGQGGQGGQRPQQTPEERERRMKEMMEAFEKAPESSFRWQFDDYRNVNGLNLPHRLSKSENNNPTEEWEISKYKANNNKITADKFVKKDKPANP